MKPKGDISINVILTLFSCFVKVDSKFQCVGTCYSGRTFPDPEDIVYGKHLKGYSYKNIPTDDPKKCYSSCYNDCRCKACQMKISNARCELLDEDKTTRANDFVEESGYVFYDLKQDSYKGKSHMVQPGKCINGCCRSKPCMNGGTCIEHCDTPKEKFSCRCTKQYTGKVCEKVIITRCYDVLKYRSFKTIPANGNFTITRTDNNKKILLYCAFTANQSWTLIESFSRANKDDFKNRPLSTYFNKNPKHPNWVDYRMSLGRIKYVRTTATLFRATCDFPKRKDSLTPDYLLGKLDDVDITSVEYLWGHCKKYMHINILGKDCFDCTAATFAKIDMHIHIDVANTVKNCEFEQSTKKYADHFGYYGTIDDRSTCVTTEQSTTQWWLGEEN